MIAAVRSLRSASLANGGLVMEPVWLGIAAPSIISAAGSVARAAASPFSAALERATDMLTGSQSDEPAESKKAESDELPQLQLGDVRAHAEKLGESVQV